MGSSLSSLSRRTWTFHQDPRTNTSSFGAIHGVIPCGLVHPDTPLGSWGFSCAPVRLEVVRIYLAPSIFPRPPWLFVRRLPGRLLDASPPSPRLTASRKNACDSGQRTAQVDPPGRIAVPGTFYFPYFPRCADSGCSDGRSLTDDGARKSPAGTSSTRAIEPARQEPRATVPAKVAPISAPIRPIRTNSFSSAPARLPPTPSFPTHCPKFPQQLACSGTGTQ